MKPSSIGRTVFWGRREVQMKINSLLSPCFIVEAVVVSLKSPQFEVYMHASPDIYGT
jgi:hypothetical protein